jgi:stage II sporulation protein D
VLAALVASAAGVGPSVSQATPGDGPPIRIRLSTDEQVATIDCAGDLRVTDLDSGRSVGHDPIGRRATFVAESAGPRPKAVYRAQVASVATEAEAKRLAADLAQRLGVPTTVRYHPDRRAWRVRVGEGATADALDPLVRSLGELGYSEVWVAEDTPESARGRLRVVDSAWNDTLAKGRALNVTPARAGDLLLLGGQSYRGTVEVRLDRRGALALINVLPIEQYLRGVVPNELGPGLYPEIEALKAQAVAARTYAWRNRGQFAEDGYDLCDSPRCQVYKGAGTEHPLTDSAIAATAGMIATWQGEPIHALYTSTCGGHTEDGVKIFPEETGAYLRGVPCYAENEGGPRRLILTGRDPGPPLTNGEGAPIGREAQLLAAAGILDPAAWPDGGAARPVDPEEAARWLGAAITVAGKGKDDPGAAPIADRNTLASELLRRLRWEERASLRAGARDQDYFLEFADGSAVPVADRRAWALFLKEGWILPAPDRTLRPQAFASRADLVRALAALLVHFQAEGLTAGSLRWSPSGSVLVDGTEGTRLYRLDPQARLVKMLKGGAFPTDRLEALPGDKVSFRVLEGEDGGEVIDYLEVKSSPRSASDDRFISVFEWEERMTREGLAAKLGSHLRGLGDLVDLVPVEHGVSGRVITLRVQGSTGSQLLRGFAIRTALGLRESLFAVDRQRAPDGSISAFLFSGKGWGHGVGLCQVGAYGMAIRGEDFRTILHHYYAGIELTSAY